MAHETEFSDTQVAGDGKRYKASDVEKVNAELAKDGKTTVKAPTYEDRSAVQEGSVADGKSGDELSGDRTPGTPSDTKPAAPRR